MQAHEAEVAGLVGAVIIAEEQADVVGRIVFFPLDLVMGDEVDVRVGAAEQRDECLAHGACEFAAVALLELHGVGEPPDDVPEGADGELHQDVAVLGAIVVREQVLAVLPDLDTEPDEITLGAVDATRFQFGVEQAVPGIEVREPHPPRVVALWH